MAISRVHSWVAGEVLTASDLNGEFNNLVDAYNVGLSAALADGTLTVPGLSFVNDGDTGLYRPGTNLLGLVAGGVEVFRASPYTSGVNFLVGVPGQAGTGAVLTASGSDTNVALLLRGKGTGYVTASSFVFENFAATQSPTITGRAYWQATEGSLHISAGSFMARIPAIVGLQAGDLIEAQNPTGVSGATVYARVQRPPDKFSRIVRETNTKINLASGYIPLKVGGAWIRRAIHSPVELIAPVVTSNTQYYIYAFDVAGVTTLEASTTTHVTATQEGVEVKSGDETRTLVGAAFAGTAGAFADSDAARFVASWFDKKPQVLAINSATNYQTSQTTYVEAASNLRIQFFTWGETIKVNAGGGDMQNSVTAGGFCFVAVGAGRGTTLNQPCNGAGGGQSPAAGNRFFYHAHTATPFSEGTGYFTIMFRVNAGNGIISATSPPETISINAGVFT